MGFSSETSAQCTERREFRREMAGSRGSCGVAEKRQHVRPTVAAGAASGACDHTRAKGGLMNPGDPDHSTPFSSAYGLSMLDVRVVACAVSMAASRRFR